MHVYHVGSAKFAYDLSGKGAELFGGRWNRRGVPCIYAASSLSLAVLEYAVNNSLENIPRALSYVVYKIPDKGWRKFEISALPDDWMQRPAPVSTMEFGNYLLKKRTHLIMGIPSVVVPIEYNFLINPLHGDFYKKVRVVAVNDFVFDMRLKQ